MLSVRLENPQSNFRVMNQGKAANASTNEASRMRYYYDKQFGNDVGSLLRQRVPYAEWLKRPLRPLKRALFSILDRPQYQGNSTLPTGYKAADTAGVAPEAALQIAFGVADQLMDTYNAAHPTKFFFRAQQITKVLA